MYRPALAPFLASLLALASLGGCSTLGDATMGGGSKVSVYQNETFEADQTFSRLFDASVADTCEAARRALLSQGYVIGHSSTSDAVNGSKRFQPDGEVHVEINFTVVCVPDWTSGKIATAYVSALQDRYVVKKSTNSTSVGVSAIGSISVPVSSNQESLVKVASETIPAGKFYDRFFSLMQKLLQDQMATDFESVAPRSTAAASR